MNGASNTLLENLPLVSKRYGFPTRRLPQDVQEPVLTMIYAFRVLDCIEEYVEKEFQKKVFDALFAALNNYENPELVKDMIPTANLDIQHRTAVLMIPKTIEAFLGMDTSLQQAILEQGKIMRKGMEKDWDILTMDDQNEYCDAVASTVGDGLTNIFNITGHIDDKTHEKLMQKSHDFGRALQKMNIIKDIRKDISNGQYFWPRELFPKNVAKDDIFNPFHKEYFISAKKELLKDAKVYLNLAMGYIKDVPKKETGIRKFLSMPLFYYSSVHKVATEYNALVRWPINIPKSQLLPQMAKLCLYKSSNRLLEKIYKKIIE